MLSGDVGIGCGWPSAKLIGCKFRIETEIRSTNPLNSQAFSTQKRKPFRNPSKVKIQCFYMAKVKWINFNFEADLCGVGGRRSILRAPFRINVESIWIKFSWFHRWIETEKNATTAKFINMWENGPKLCVPKNWQAIACYSSLLLFLFGQRPFHWQCIFYPIWILSIEFDVRITWLNGFYIEF